MNIVSFKQAYLKLFRMNLSIPVLKFYEMVSINGYYMYIKESMHILVYGSLLTADNNMDMYCVISECDMYAFSLSIINTQDEMCQ